MLPPAHYLSPQRGASVLFPVGVSGVLVAAGATNAPVRFRWPFRTMVIGLQVATDSGDPKDLAALGISIEDGDVHRVTTDGQGLNLFVSGLELIGGVGTQMRLGLGWGRAFAFQRLVQSGELWTFTVRNRGVSDIIPEIGFRLGVPNG